MQYWSIYIWEVRDLQVSSDAKKSFCIIYPKKQIQEIIKG